MAALQVKDLPEIWNAKMQDYLGIVPPNDAQGVLQDVHWSGGSIGYFSTYALGNIVSAQLWEKINKDIPDLENRSARVKFDELRGWLRKKIHVHGHKYDPQDLVQKSHRLTIDSAAYVRYLTKKYSECTGCKSIRRIENETPCLIQGVSSILSTMKL
jgi:carboxypeptidase Taq